MQDSVLTPEQSAKRIWPGGNESRNSACPNASERASCSERGHAVGQRRRTPLWMRSMDPPLVPTFCVLTKLGTNTGSFDNVPLLLSFSDGREDYDGKKPPRPGPPGVAGTNAKLFVNLFCSMLANTNVRRTQLRPAQTFPGSDRLSPTNDRPFPSPNCLLASVL